MLSLHIRNKFVYWLNVFAGSNVMKTLVSDVCSAAAVFTVEEIKKMFR